MRAFNYAALRTKNHHRIAPATNIFIFIFNFTEMSEEEKKFSVIVLTIALRSVTVRAIPYRCIKRINVFRVTRFS